MCLLSKSPHRVNIPYSIESSYISITPDYSQKFVFISTSKSVYLYTANIVFEFVSHITFTEEQHQEFGSIVDIKSSQTLPLLALVTNKNLLLILTYDKEEFSEPFTRSGSEPAPSPRDSISSTSSIPNVYVSGEMTILMIFSLYNLLVKPSDNISMEMYTSLVSNGPYVGTTWEKSSLYLNTTYYIAKIDFDKIASSKIKIMHSDKDTTLLQIEVRKNDLYVEQSQIGLVLTEHTYPFLQSAAGDSPEFLTFHGVTAYFNHIYYKDSANRFLCTGNSNLRVLSESINHYSISSIIAYTNIENNSQSDVVHIATCDKKGGLKELDKIFIKGEITKLSWCPQGSCLGIIHKVQTNDSLEANYAYFLTLYNYGNYDVKIESKSTCVEVRVPEITNIVWSSFGLRLFIITLDSVHLFDLYRSSGWISGHFYSNDLLIGPSSMIYKPSTEDSEFLYDYPLSTTSLWPFALAFPNPSSSLFLIRSHNGALLVCNRHYGVSNTSKFSLNKVGKQIYDHNIVTLNRQWQLIESQWDSDCLANLDNYSIPCCWIDDDLFLTFGVSDTNPINHNLKILRYKDNAVSVVAKLRVRRSPLIAKKIELTTSPINISRDIFGLYFFILTRFNKIEIYHWLQNTDSIKLVTQLHLTFPLHSFPEISELSSSRLPSTRPSSFHKKKDNFVIKSLNIKFIHITMQMINNFNLFIVSEGQNFNISIINNQLYFGDKNDAHTPALSEKTIEFKENEKLLDLTRQLFETSKHHFINGGKLANLSHLLNGKDISNTMIMRISRMALEYGALDESVLSTFCSFVKGKDYLNASLLLVCVQSVVGRSEMISGYARPLLLLSIQDLGHNPSLIHLINQLKRIINYSNNVDDSGILKEVNEEILIATGKYALKDFLGLIRVALLLDLPLINVLSKVNINWRLCDCDTHFQNKGVTTIEIIDSINAQFFTKYRKSGEYVQSHRDTDGWSLSAVFNLLLPLYYVSKEAGLNCLAFAIALCIEDKNMARLAVNDHIALEIDRLDPDCIDCDKTRDLIEPVLR